MIPPRTVAGSVSLVVLGIQYWEKGVAQGLKSHRKGDANNNRRTVLFAAVSATR